VARVQTLLGAMRYLTLMRDGRSKQVLGGLYPCRIRQRRLNDYQDKGCLERGISVVPFPAFTGANITEVREEQETPADLEPDNEQERESMSDNMELEVRSVMDEVAELRRVVEAGQTSHTPAIVGAEYRSQGEFAKALLKGEAGAIELARAASDSSDTVALPGFIGYIDNLIDNNRPALSVFSRASLPASGLTVEYASVSANTIAVGQQDPEGEALSFGNLTIASTSAAVKTYGGYTSSPSRPLSAAR
jgi:uncharacterized protein